MKNLTKLSALLAATLMLNGCFHDSDDNDKPEPAPEPTPEVTYLYKVTVLNLTNNQPLSPIASMIHDDKFKAWTLGAASSVPLEVLAESGDNAQLLEDALLLTSTSGDAPLMPGNSYSSELTTKSTDVMLTIVSMLVNTNDAFTGLNQHDLSGYEVGDWKTVNLSVYDSGTEANNEVADSIPGP
ncbi:MAG: hypothetical protein HRU25_08210, partial [Psychrobium sp.]|nr:hypothetical protein [Psychrobium sp.]